MSFVVHHPEILRNFLDYVSGIIKNLLVSVRFGIRTLAEPEPDQYEPEPRVWFGVRGNTPNRTGGPVRGSGKNPKNRTEPNLTITSIRLLV
jgi:hypothetical protein